MVARRLQALYVRRFMCDAVAKCQKRHKKRLGVETDKSAAPQLALKKDDLVVQQWKTLPDDGSGIPPTSKEDQET